MKRKILCISLVLMMCLLAAVPTYADGEAETLPERVEITTSFGLKHISGSTYRMWARINNPNQASVYATLALYDVSYNLITAVGTVSSDMLIGLDKYISLSSGTYYVRITTTVNGSTVAWEKTYNI